MGMSEWGEYGHLLAISNETMRYSEARAPRLTLAMAAGTNVMYAEWLNIN